MGMSKKQIVEKLTALGINFDPEAKVADLIALLPAEKEKTPFEQIREKIQKDYSKPIDFNLQRNQGIALSKLSELEHAIFICNKVKKIAQK